MSKQIEFATSEEFKKKVVEEFLPTLQHSTPCQITNYTFPNENVCLLQVATQQGMMTLSIWRDKNTNFAEYCYGQIGKYSAKDIN